MLRALLVKIIPRLGSCHADGPYSSIGTAACGILQLVLCDWCQICLSACV